MNDLIKALQTPVTTNIYPFKGYGQDPIKQTVFRQVPDIYPKTVEGAWRINEKVGMHQSQGWFWSVIFNAE